MIDETGSPPLPVVPANSVWTYRMGWGVAVVTSFLTIWTTLIRDDGNGIGFLMLVVAAAVGAFAVEYRPAGMARAMLGIAFMEILLSVARATDPSVVALPGSSVNAMSVGVALAAHWIASAVLFRLAAKHRAILSS